MGTNKERIEHLETGLGLGMIDKLHHLEEALNRLSNVLLANPESSNQGNYHRENQNGGRQIWFNWMEQFFDYQGTAENQKVPMVAYHLEGRPTKCGGGCRMLKEEGHKALVGTFMGGLKVEIADGIRMFKPQSLKEVINLARMRNDQLTRQRRFMWLLPVRAPIALPQATRVAPATPAKPIKHLSWEEMQRKRAQVLINKRWKMTMVERQQRCRNMNLNRDHLARTNRMDKENHAVMKMGPHEVMVLIDRSTHNFIKQPFGKHARVAVIPMETFPIRVANGERLTCTKFYLTLFSLPLSGLDLVLGVQWLEMLGSVVCNWKQLTMDFIWENQDRRLQGVDVQTIQAASPEEILKEFRQGHALFAVCFQPTMETAPADAPTKVTQQSMQRLLKEYEDVFQEPSSLPPHMKWIIRFCDYHTLNVTTIKDRFPIPTMDDMLEELYGATYFTKFDMRATNIGDFATTPIFAKASKCVFGQCELEYLGHIVTHQGVKVDMMKLQPWLNRYYRKFVQNYGIIATPTNPLKKGKFGWNDEAEAAFLALKQAMKTTPTLAMPNFNDSFTIETDASGEGIGAILSQQGRPIAFMSRALGVTKKSWLTYAKEMLAIVEAIRLWRLYLLGKKFFILTDQHRENSATDALSRKSGSLVLLHLHVPVVTVWDEIKKAYEGDSYVQSLTRLANAQLEGSYAWRNGLLFFKGRVVIPSHAALRTKLLHEMHDTKIGGHSRVLRTFKKLAQQFYWPKMYQAKVKSETMPLAGLLQPLPIPCQVWDDITLDFIEGLPTSHGKDTILVVVDRLSKSTHFLALTHPFIAKIVAERFSLLRTISMIQKIGAVAYKLQLRKEPTFILSSTWAVILEPQHILDTRWVKRGNKFEEENLIQWKHLPIEDATWETNQSLLERFPPMDLGDKRPLNDGGLGPIIGFVDLALGWLDNSISILEEIVDEEKFPLLSAWMQDFADASIIKNNWPPRDKMIVKFQALLDAAAIAASAAASSK
ncbi:hypothetical protein AAG906_019052 [Vitis piasezkii]